MASFILSKPLLVLLLIVIQLSSRISISDATFSFTTSDKNTSFASEDFALYGDAKFIDGGSSIELTTSKMLGGGRVLYKKPIESRTNRYSQCLDGFSTVFSFSLFPDYVREFGFVVFPFNKTSYHSLFEVRFVTMDYFAKFRDSNVMVSVNGATVPDRAEKIQNFTITNLEKTGKVLLYAWINYRAGWKVLEVRLSKSKSFGDSLPLNFGQIGLSEMLKGELEFMVGVNSYGGKVNLHSWSLNVRHYEHSTGAIWFSEELRKEEVEKKRRRESIRKEEVEKKRRRESTKEFVTCFVMTFGSIGLMFFAMMRIWEAFKRNNHVMQEYEKMEKMEVVISKADAKQESK